MYFMNDIFTKTYLNIITELIEAGRQFNSDFPKLNDLKFYKIRFSTHAAKNQVFFAAFPRPPAKNAGRRHFSARGGLTAVIGPCRTWRCTGRWPRTRRVPPPPGH